MENIRRPAPKYCRSLRNTDGPRDSPCRSRAAIKASALIIRMISMEPDAVATRALCGASAVMTVAPKKDDHDGDPHGGSGNDSRAHLVSSEDGFRITRAVA